MPSSRKIAYILGAGFSFGSGHCATVGKHNVRMPLQFTLFEELCRFHYKKRYYLDDVARTIRAYFNPNTYRATRGKGHLRHSDLFGLSVEEIVTFFDEIVTNKKENSAEIEEVQSELQQLTVELISFLSINGNPGQNSILRLFARRLAQTDVVVTFNWDTILDRVISKQKKYQWHPAWGYGTSVRDTFEFSARTIPSIARKYPRLLKLHGSINWIAFRNGGENKSRIMRGWHPHERYDDVVMMPPKMIKTEVWGRPSTDDQELGVGGNRWVEEDFYPRLWKEAEEQLSNCRRLVFIGYSFPPADFAVSNMLRRAISAMKLRTGSFPVVDIVDPRCAELSDRFNKSFKIEVKPDNQYISLQSYLNSSRPR